ncbi:MAG: hypothetical protein KAI44_05895, partial [Methylococcales bacterium]|nr:hypothetical protein [Methylococcales bacterium]
QQLRSLAMRLLLRLEYEQKPCVKLSDIIKSSLLKGIFNISCLTKINRDAFIPVKALQFASG